MQLCSRAWGPHLHHRLVLWGGSSFDHAGRRHAVPVVARAGARLEGARVPEQAVAERRDGEALALRVGVAQRLAARFASGVVVRVLGLGAVGEAALAVTGEEVRIEEVRIDAAGNERICLSKRHRSECHMERLARPQTTENTIGREGADLNQ